MLDRQIGDMLKLFARIDAPRRIGRVDQHDHPRPAGNLGGDRLFRNGKAVGLVEMRDHHLAACKLGLADMLRIIGIEQDHLVARIDRGHERCKRGMGEPVGHQHLIDAVIELVEIAQFLHQRLAEGERAAKIAIMDYASVERGLGRLLDMVGRIGMRPPEFQMDEINPRSVEFRSLVVHAEALLRSRCEALCRPFHSCSPLLCRHMHNCVICNISSFNFPQSDIPVRRFASGPRLRTQNGGGHVVAKAPCARSLHLINRMRLFGGAVHSKPRSVTMPLSSSGILILRVPHSGTGV